jgi:Na+-transporting NADH:ubiquinone oxidoreductase subunit NqrC
MKSLYSLGLGHKYSALIADSRAWWKKISVAVVVSIVSAIVSVGTVTISVLTLRQQMADKDREVLNQALTLATDKTGGADRRVAGIWALNYYWSKPQYSNLVASTLTALLALNADNDGSLRLGRCAAAEVIGNAINIEPQYRDGTTEVTNVAHILYGEWNGKYSLGV